MADVDHEVREVDTLSSAGFWEPFVNATNADVVIIREPASVISPQRRVVRLRTSECYAYYLQSSGAQTEEMPTTYTSDAGVQTDVERISHTDVEVQTVDTLRGMTTVIFHDCGWERALAENSWESMDLVESRRLLRAIMRIVEREHFDMTR